MSLRLLCAFALLATTACASSPRVGSDWVQLGEQTVTDRLDRDRITVRATRGEFRRIKLTVGRVSVDFDRVVVHFGNGDRQVIEMRGTIRAGGETRSIDLDGGDRVIRYVEFLYDANSVRGGRAVVRLFGRR
jgi:hypothetical protein